MEVFLLIIHILCSIGLVVVILLQSGKGGGLGSGFGGAGAAATQIFGGRGAGNFLSRTTVVLAAVFMTTSLSLAYISSQPRSLMDLEADGGGGAASEDEVIERGSGPAPQAEQPTVVPEPTGGESDTAPVESDAPAEDGAAPDVEPDSEEQDDAAGTTGAAAPAPSAPDSPNTEPAKKEAATAGPSGSPLGGAEKLQESKQAPTAADSVQAKPEDEALPAPAKQEAPESAE